MEQKTTEQIGVRLKIFRSTPRSLTEYDNKGTRNHGEIPEVHVDVAPRVPRFSSRLHVSKVDFRVKISAEVFLSGVVILDRSRRDLPWDYDAP